MKVGSVHASHEPLPAESVGKASSSSSWSSSSEVDDPRSILRVIDPKPE